jgi:hypothetical protein
MKKLFLVTVLGEYVHFSSETDGWLRAQHGIQVGESTFLFYDEITLEQAFEKLVGLVPKKARISAFPVELPFIHHLSKVLEDDLARLFGEEAD